MSESTADEVQRLRSQLKDKDEQLQTAGQFGLNLIENQTALETRLEEQRVEMTNAMEALEQEKYSLKREVDLKIQVLESLRSDYDFLKSQQRQQLQQQEEQLERNHSTVLAELKEKVERMRSDLEESQLNEKQLRHKLEVQTATLSNKMEELRALNEHAQDTMSSEVLELQTKSMELEEAKMELEQSLQEAQYREQQMLLTNSNLQRQLQRITDDKEEREKEAVSWFNALEKSREANQDLQIQLEQLLQQAQDPNSKGNSLFAELEDRRAEMERKLISVKVQYQSLLKQHAFSKQQLHRMKVQVATLMQLQGSRADPAQLERLQSMLSDRNSEIESLMTKVQKLEKVEMVFKSQPVCPAPGDSGNSQDETYYTDLLLMKLNNSTKDAERMGDELSRQRMKALSESQRALELERKLFTAERLLKQAQSDKLKLQLRVEELKHKYEPNEVNKHAIQRKRKEKLPVDIIPPSAVMKVEAVAACEMETKRPVETMPRAQLLTDTDVLKQVPDSDQPPAKCVRISEEPPVTIANVPSSPQSDCKVTKEKGETETQEHTNFQENTTCQEKTAWADERRRRQHKVEVIHVSSKETMENQCAQQ